MVDTDYKNECYKGIIDSLKQFNETGCINTDTLRDVEEYCRNLRHHIMHEQSAYFIAVNDIGPDDNFVRIYTLLGFVTEQTASEAVKDLSDSEGIGGWGGRDGYVKVTKEEYEKYDTLRRLTTAKTSMTTALSFTKNIESFSKAFLDLEKEIDILRSEVGFEYHWEHVAPHIWYPKCDDQDD